MTQPKVIVGISGGVDSAVAALLLQRQGYEVAGVFMKNWSEDDFGGPCPWAEDQVAATAVAEHLKITLETWNFEKPYRERVFGVMLHEYQAGRTPNPDILCNREIKFDMFLQQALKSVPIIATGHYARVKDGKLYKAFDHEKDQSYFLSAVPASAFRRTLFPLGEVNKTEVRKIAKQAKLPNWDRPDSTGICFIGERNIVNFLSKYIEWNPGPIILSSGEQVGRHRGLQFYTIGQRKGFGVDLDQARLSKLITPNQPVFVTEKRVLTNTLVIAPADHSEQLETKEFLVAEPHWISSPSNFPWTGMAKLRYRQPDIPVALLLAGQKIRVSCKNPQRAVTPGQYAVFYQDQECLGSAVIDNREGW